MSGNLEMERTREWSETGLTERKVGNRTNSRTVGFRTNWKKGRKSNELENGRKPDQLKERSETWRTERKVGNRTNWKKGRKPDELKESLETGQTERKVGNRTNWKAGTNFVGIITRSMKRGTWSELLLGGWGVPHGRNYNYLSEACHMVENITKWLKRATRSEIYLRLRKRAKRSEL